MYLGDLTPLKLLVSCSDCFFLQEVETRERISQQQIKTKRTRKNIETG